MPLNALQRRRRRRRYHLLLLVIALTLVAVALALRERRRRYLERFRREWAFRPPLTYSLAPFDLDSWNDSSIKVHFR